MSYKREVYNMNLNILFIWQGKDEKYFIHNHLSFIVKYHRDEQRDVSRIVAFEVKPYRYISVVDVLNSYVLKYLNVHILAVVPFNHKNDVFCSVKHEYEGQWNDKKTHLTTCDPHAQRVITSSESPQEVEVGKDIIFTYDVDFKVRIEYTRDFSCTRNK
jgi:transmembrane 9 superfamily member 2/4